MTNALTVSAIQYQALDGGIVPNAMEHVRLIEDAESHGARLAVFPELSLTGYNLRTAGLTRTLARAGRRRASRMSVKSAAAPGLPPSWEAHTGNPGALRGWRPSPSTRTAPPNSPSKHTCTAGKRISLLPARVPASCELDGWRIGLAICFDAAVPAHSTGAAEAGADAYAVSAVYTQDEDHRLELHLGARAMDNRMFAILANLGGTTALGPSCGLSGFWGPDGCG